MPPALFPLLKTAHVVAAVLFVGNVVVTGVWAAVCYRARATHDFRLAARAIVMTDWLFTLGGAVILVGSGVAMAVGRGFPLWETPWIRNAIVALVISTLAWLIVLVPAQREMLHLDPISDSSADQRLVRAFRRWTITGWAATAPLIYAIWCMVAKPIS
jgi:uncharacterized membrane protein